MSLLKAGRNFNWIRSLSVITGLLKHIAFYLIGIVGSVGIGMIVCYGNDSMQNFN